MKIERIKVRAKLGIQSGQSSVYGEIDQDGWKSVLFCSERPTGGDFICDLTSCLKGLF